MWKFREYQETIQQLRTVPTEEVPAQAVEVTSNGDAVATPEETKAVSAATTAAPVAADAPVTAAEVAIAATTDATAVAADEVKSDTKKSPLRLVKGFRAAKWRRKISLDTEKNLADNVRKNINSRRIKYERFVKNVLGKASPVGTTEAPVVVHRKIPSVLIFKKIE